MNYQMTGDQDQNDRWNKPKPKRNEQPGQTVGNGYRFESLDTWTTVVVFHLRRGEPMRDVKRQRLALADQQNTPTFYNTHYCLARGRSEEYFPRTIGQRRDLNGSAGLRRSREGVGGFL